MAYSVLSKPDPSKGTPFHVTFIISGKNDDGSPIAVVGDEYEIFAITGLIFFESVRGRIEHVSSMTEEAEIVFTSRTGFTSAGEFSLEFIKKPGTDVCFRTTVKVGATKSTTRSTDVPPPIPKSSKVKINKHLLPGKGKSTHTEIPDNLLEPVDKKKEKWNMKRFWTTWKNHWMIGIFLVLLLGVGGYFGYKNLYPAKVPPHAQAKVQPKTPKIEEEVIETDEAAPEPVAETAESITSGSLAEAAAKQAKEAEALALETKAADTAKAKAEASAKLEAEKAKADVEEKAKAAPKKDPAPSESTGTAPKRYEKIHFSHLPPVAPFTGVAPGHM